MSNKKAIVAGAVIGASVAAASVLLTTPMSGREMREKVKKSLEETIASGDDLLNKIKQVGDGLVKTASLGAEKVKPILTEVRQAVETWRKEAAPHKKNIETQMSEIEAALAQLEDAFSNFSHETAEN